MRYLIAALCLASMSLPAYSVTLMTDHDLGGSQSDVVWEDFSNANPTLAPTTGSGMVMPSNGGYQASMGFYKWSGAGAYTLTFNKSDFSFDAQTVVLQLQWGLNTEYTLTDSLLSFNGGSQNIAATWSGQTSLISPVYVPSMGGNVDFSVYTWQWDLSSLAEDITSITISVNPSIHTSTVAGSLEVGGGVHSEAVFTAVPEPSTWLLLGVGCGVVLMFRHRRSVA